MTPAQRRALGPWLLCGLLLISLSSMLAASRSILDHANHQHTARASAGTSSVAPHRTGTAKLSEADAEMQQAAQQAQEDWEAGWEGEFEGDDGMQLEELPEAPVSRRSLLQATHRTFFQIILELTSKYASSLWTSRRGFVVRNAEGARLLRVTYRDSLTAGLTLGVHQYIITRNQAAHLLDTARAAADPPPAGATTPSPAASPAPSPTATPADSPAPSPIPSPLATPIEPTVPTPVASPTASPAASPAVTPAAIPAPAPTPAPATGTNTTLEVGPDMIVVREVTEESFSNSDPNFVVVCFSENPADITYCDAVEAGISNFTCHRVLRFSVGIGNIGNADLAVGRPQDHIAANDGLFVYAPCHQHFHWRGFAKYEIVDDRNNSWHVAKRGFCAQDSELIPFNYKPKGKRASSRKFAFCGFEPGAGNAKYNQGVSVGWMDIYNSKVSGQFVCLDGCADQPPMPRNQTYYIRVTANPPFDFVPGEPCPHRDPEGKCRMFQETDYSNNEVVMPFFMPTEDKLVQLPYVNYKGDIVSPPLPPAASPASPARRLLRSL